MRMTYAMPSAAKIGTPRAADSAVHRVLSYLAARAQTRGVSVNKLGAC
jgi:hypothetical protein